MGTDEPNLAKNNKLSISLDMRMIILVLVLVITGMLAAWRPWADKPPASSRTVSVTGEAMIKAEPDEFVFSPSYEFKNQDKAAALAELTKKSEEIVSKLKSLGVADNQIKSDSDGYNYSYYYDDRAQQNNYSLRLTITLNSKEMAQKIQDYLVSTSPAGSVSPQARFSEGKRKELESKARDEATKDARGKAEQSARNFGFKIGKVKSVDDGAGFGDIMPYARGQVMLDAAAADKSSLSVQPGENDLAYRVSVVYYVR